MSEILQNQVRLTGCLTRALRRGGQRAPIDSTLDIREAKWYIPLPAGDVKQLELYGT